MPGFSSPIEISHRFKSFMYCSHIIVPTAILIQKVRTVRNIPSPIGPSCDDVPYSIQLRLHLIRVAANSITILDVLHFILFQLVD